MRGLGDRVILVASLMALLALNLPALVVIVLCYLWIGLNETAAIVAVAFNKIALVLVTMREGARTLDRPVAEMAKVYRMRFPARLRHVILPQLAPYISSAARGGLSIIWKLVLMIDYLLIQPSEIRARRWCGQAV
ncbi:ABC transporter permease subunit [Actibacterium sp.]|uniref:ABC transporter permease subunit n=1 Tax=Actibacterium sp. TaxID=1872125 RepID=UPI0035617F9A